MSDIKAILNGENVREVLSSYDLLEMANVLGDFVKTDRISFSFYFSDKYGMQHGIHVKIKWNGHKFTKPEDGYMELHGTYAYVPTPGSKKVSNRDINLARSFFKKYKVLFAAVWEGVVDQMHLQQYFLGNITLQDLIDQFDPVIEHDFSSVESLEAYVRKNNLYNLND